MAVNDGSISTELYQFLATNFHQDWDLESDDWQGVVDNYVAADPAPEPLRRLAQQIDELRGSRTESDLEEFLVRRVGVDFRPDTLNHGEWLRQIANRLRRHAEITDGRTASKTDGAPEAL